MFELPDNTNFKGADMETVSLILEAFYNRSVFVDFNDDSRYDAYYVGRDGAGRVCFMNTKWNVITVGSRLISQRDWDEACRIMRKKGWHLLKMVGQYDNSISYRMSDDFYVFEGWEVIF